MKSRIADAVFYAALVSEPISHTLEANRKRGNAKVRGIGDFMRIMKWISVLATPLLLAWPQTARAWNATGHETVALIAYDQLTADQKKYFDGILENHQQRDEFILTALQPGDDRQTFLFIASATWPDLVRNPLNGLSRTENHPAWHYVDYPYDLDGKTGPQPVEQWDGKSDPANLLQAMQKVVPEFNNPKTTAARRAIDLCWILHLVGDIHQPLHATSLYSNTYPDGDRGGNMEMVLVNNQPMVLHAFWDDLEGTDVHLVQIRAIADRIEQEHPADELKAELAKTDVKEWALESLAEAKSKVYDNGNIPGMPRDLAQQSPDAVPSLSDAYQTEAHKTADMRVAEAGYRLAALLQRLTAKSP